MTPMETNTKAARVPMFTSYPSVTSGRKNASSAATTPVMIVILCGVRKVRLTRANQGHSVPSHREGHPALPEHQYHYHQREAYEDCERDDELRDLERCRLQRRGSSVSLMDARRISFAISL